jgi:hypothetical protein
MLSAKLVEDNIIDGINASVQYSTLLPHHVDVLYDVATTKRNKVEL